jgi:malonyl-CoA O-methyltransferase
MSRALSAATLEAYERWAPLYAPTAHNPLMRAEQRAMLEHWPEVTGRRALDLACGTGRYSRLLREGGAGPVVALDFCAAMLSRVSSASPVRADMMRLPFADGAFDVVVSALAAGHATSFPEWAAEVARVLVRGGTFLYSDFHPEAIEAGLTRSFKDGNDRTCTVPHRCHGTAMQAEALAAAGLTVETACEVRVGLELREAFPRSDAFYRRWYGVPIVLVMRARK